MAPRDERTIDDVDRRLVELLRSDGRMSNRALAGELGLNEVTVGSRLRRLEADRILQVVALTDFEAFGYPYLAFVLVNVTGVPAAEVAEDLARIPQTVSITVATGRFDIVATVLARDLEHLGEVIGEQISSVSGVERTCTELALSVLRYDSKWSALRTQQEYERPSLVADGIDETDRKIIAALQQDARSSNRGIAADLGISEGTIRSRLKRMEAERKIKIQAVSDIEAFGLGSNAVVGIHVSGGAVAQVGKALLDVPGVLVLFRSLGEFDLIAGVVAYSREELLATLLGRIQGIPNVHSTETFETAFAPKHAFTWARIF